MVVVYDPDALVRDQKFYVGAPDSIENEAAKGNLLLLQWKSEPRLRLYVDEPVDADVEKHIRTRTEGFLRVPSGQLIAIGAEVADVQKHAGQCRYPRATTT